MAARPMVRVFVCGDVMLGRGIDQIQAVSCEPRIFESYVKDARDYVKFATRQHGPLPNIISPSYVWGDAIGVLEQYRPDVRLINLETAVTSRGQPWPGKGIQYRMHPENVSILQAANIDAVSLANNHVLDWSAEGLSDSLLALSSAGVRAVGAGASEREASTAALFRLADGSANVVIYGIAHGSSGVPREWAARGGRAGLNFVADLNDIAVEKICNDLRSQCTSSHNIVIVSIHWGGNWGFEVPSEFRNFAHRLIDSGLVSLVHGHSSHHVKGFEVYKKRLILFGCGDFINDYEGIWGSEKDEYKDYLSLMYFVDFTPTSGELAGLTMVPTRLRKLRVNRASPSETEWLLKLLQRECAKFGCRVALTEDKCIKLVL